MGFAEYSNFDRLGLAELVKMVPIPKKKHEPVSDIDTVAVDGLKALDPKRPIREEDNVAAFMNTRRAQAWRSS